MRVAISAGHYPRSQGASFKGTTEYKLAVSWICDIQMHLKELGVSTVIVPATNLRKKVDFINRANVGCCLELHFNDFTNKRVRGCETLYCPNSYLGKLFALSVHNWYSPIMNNPDRGVKEGYYKLKGQTIDYYLQQTYPPAVIVEPEFIAHHKGANAHKIPACRGIAKGIKQFLDMI